MTVARTETGERPVRLDEAVTLAQVLGMPVPLADEAMAHELADAHQRIADLTAEVAKLQTALNIERDHHGAALKTLSGIEQAIRDHRESRRR